MTRATIISADGRILEFADQARASRVAAAENAQVVRSRKGDIVRVELLTYSDDSLRKPRGGNPLKLSHKHETDANPRGVWDLTPLSSPFSRAAYRV